MSNSVANQAKAFADLGYYVFPLHKKLPILKGWPDKCTKSHEIIDQWYDTIAKTADGFGICPKDTCVIIDVDVGEGKDGIKSLKWLISEFGLSNATQVIRTKSGGLHLYYKYPKLLQGQHIKSVANWKVNGNTLNGIDIRGNRGQAVGPTDKNGYEIIDSRHVSELAELPESLIQFLPVDKVGGLKVDKEDASALIGDDNYNPKGVIPDVIPAGERHQTLLSLTASWARKVPYDTAKVLLKEAVSRCEGSGINYDDYLVRLDDAYDKFEPVIEDKLQWMLDNLLYVVSTNSVFRLDKPGNVANIDMSTANNYFKNWVITVEKETDSGIKVSQKPCMAAWLSHMQRQTVERVGYKPVSDQYYTCGVMGERLVNSYKPTNIKPSNEFCDGQWFVSLVKFLWREEADLILDLCAHIIQNPTQKVHWAPLLITEYEGMGKNIFFEALSMCVGKWNAAIINAGMLSKTFNTFLANNQIVLINEVQEVSKRERQSVVSKLKSYITETVQSIEAKGVDVVTQEIFSNLFIFSNKIDSVDVEERSRRFHVFINDSEPMPDKWYTNIASYLNEDGISGLMYLLVNRDISNFKYSGHAPSTESKEIVVNSSRSEYELEVRRHIEDRFSIFESDIITDETWQYYVTYVLHKGDRMSTSQEKYLKSHLFKRVRSHNGVKYSSRQVTLNTVNKLSDEMSLIKGLQPRKTLAYTVRNHDDYVQTVDNKIPASVISNEFDKCFGDNKSSSNVVALK